MNPSEFPEVRPHPHLRRLLAVQIDMQFDDLRTLLQLPSHNTSLSADCNLTTASLLFNVIAGTSVLFYDASLGALNDRADRGRRFRALLADYYPWSPSDAFGAEESSTVIYDFARNPLTHTLGVSKVPRLFPGAPPLPHGATAVMLEKGPLDPHAVEAVTDPSKQPEALGPTLRHEDDELILSVWSLAWGVHRMLRDLFADDAQVERAHATAEALLEA